MKKQPVPNHVAGTPRGEEQALNKREPGRDDSTHGHRGPRDSTGINADKRAPILPVMPNIPPA